MDDEKMIESFMDLRNYKVISKYYSYRIDGILSNLNNYIINPFFQRYDAWDLNQKSELIESIIFGMPIPAIYTLKNNNKEIVMDGKQRLTTIKDFTNNKFKLQNLKVYKFLNSLDYFTLPDEYKDKIDSYTLDFIRIDNINNSNVFYDIFKRFNSNATFLNNQEIRNCIYSGPYNEMIKRLSTYKPFYEILKKENIDRMEKEECAARFIAFYQNFDLYKGDMNSFIDKSYEINLDLKNITPEEFAKKEKEVTDIFTRLVDSCIEVFGKNVFKSINIKKSKTNNQVCYWQFSKPVFDLQMLGFIKYDFAIIRRNAGKLRKAYENAILNDIEIRPDHRKMSRVAFELRLKKWRAIIDDILNNEM